MRPYKLGEPQEAKYLLELAEELVALSGRPGHTVLGSGARHHQPSKAVERRLRLD